MWNAIIPERLGVAICNFDGQVKHGLTINIGDIVQIHEECLGWYRGCTLKNKSTWGLFPASYVAFKKCQQLSDKTVSVAEDVTVSEVGYVLREWNAIRKRMFTEVYNKRNAKFAVVGQVMVELMDSRRLLISESLTSEQMKELKSKVSKNIDWGNKLLGLDVIPRVNDEPVDGSGMNPLELHQLHLKSTGASRDIATLSKTPNKSKISTRLQSIAGQSASSAHARNVASSGSWSSFHVLVSASCFVSSVEHDIQVAVRLFDATDFRPFTESFIVQINKNGKVSRPDGQPNCSVLFKDLTREDRERDAYVVVQVHRVGSLKEADGNNSSSSNNNNRAAYRRPLGCGATRITDALAEKVSSDDCFSFNCRIMSCSEQDFPSFHEHLMRADLDSGSCERPSGKNFCMTMSLRLFFGEADDLLARDGHLFKGVALSDKLGFPDVIKPNAIRNDLYVTLVCCDFERSSKTSQKSVEARLVVADKSGKELQECIRLGSGMPPSSEYRSPVVYHCNSPRWNETITLTVPVEWFFECHLRIEFRYCSHKQKPDKKFIGFAFLRLSTSDVTTLRDGLHELRVYKCDEAKLQTSSYLMLPDVSSSSSSSTASRTEPSPHFQLSEKESVCVETLLCSTKLTQNLDIVKLLQWKVRSEEVEGILTGFMKVEGREIVKFLPDILDALFDMLGNVPQEEEMLAFKSLVQIFNILNDCKFESFKSVFEMYLANNFAGTLVFRSLIGCLCRAIKSSASFASCPASSDVDSLVVQSEEANLLQNAFRALDLITKCIVQSCCLFVNANVGCGGDFSRDLYALVQSLCDVLASPSVDDMINVQTTCLANVPRFLLNLSPILSPEDLGLILGAIVRSLPESVPSQIHKGKLKCLHALSSSELFQKAEWRRTAMPVYSGQMRLHFERRQNVKLVMKILTEVLLFFHECKTKNEPKREEVQLLLDNLLVPLIDIVLETVADDSGNQVACLVSMLSFLDDERSYDAFLATVQKELCVKKLLTNIFEVLDLLVTSDDAFPRDWFAAKMNMNRTILEASRFLEKTLSQSFSTTAHFDVELWNGCFVAAVDFITQPALQLETFSPAKSLKVKAAYGDMRVTMAHRLSSMWNVLGDNKIHFVPHLVGPFLRVALIREATLRSTVLPMFFGMIECHQQHFGNFQKVEDELIVKLDAHLNEDTGDADFLRLFRTTMTEKLNEVEEDWKVIGQDFVQSVCQLLERLLDYRSTLEEKNDDNAEIKMISIVNLLDFYKEDLPNKREAYVRYVGKLSDLHLSRSNHVEAAFTLLLHAKLHRWTTGTGGGGCSFGPRAGQKEALYLRIIEEFDRGKCWEYGLPLCEELAVVYKESVEYNKLSRILQTQSEFYHKILSTHRLQPSYFRVAFYGKRFPTFLRNKEFVYRGGECEKLSSFQSRMCSLFPDTENLSVNAGSSDVSFDTRMYIQINIVQPIADIPVRFLESDVVTESIRSFHRCHDVDAFVLDRPYHKGEVDPNNEFMTLHIERLTLHTSSSLPGILRWAAVEATDSAHLGPIEVAMDAMRKKNDQLRSLVVEYSKPSCDDATTTAEVNLSPLSMILQGVIDAAVMGGVKKYQQVFLSDDFLANNPEHSDQISHLRELLEEQMEILGKALSIHGRLASTDVQPLHKRLVELFHDMKRESDASSSSPSERGSCSSISCNTPANRNSGSFNDSEHTPSEPSLFKQKSQTTSRWYTDEPVRFPVPVRSKNYMTSRASAILNFKSNKKNLSTPTLLRMDSVKRLTIREDDRPASDTVVKDITVAGSCLDSDSHTEPRIGSYQAGTSSNNNNHNNSLPRFQQPVPPLPPPPPKRVSTHHGQPKPPAVLPKPPPPPPIPESDSRTTENCL